MCVSSRSSCCDGLKVGARPGSGKRETRRARARLRGRARLAGWDRADRRVHRSLHDSGYAVSAVAPSRLRHFAMSVGRLAKTDLIDDGDAREVRRDGRRTAGDAAEGQLPVPAGGSDGAAQRARRRPDEDRPDRGRADAGAKKVGKGVRADLDARITDLDVRIAAMFEEELEFGERHRIPLSGRGIGEIVAAAPCCRIPGPGRIGRRRAAALAGVAPVARDSGRKAGVHRIRRDGRDWGSRSTWWPSRRPTTIWICGNRASARSRRGRHSTSKPKCNTRPRPGFVLAFFGGLPT